LRGHREPRFGWVVDTKRHKLPWRRREPAPLGPPMRRMLLSMQNTPEIKTELTPPNVFERLAGMRFVYATTIADDVCEVVGRGPTPEASHEAAQTQWELAQLCDHGNTAAMFP
jgi:hypothetical protein